MVRIAYRGLLVLAVAALVSVAVGSNSAFAAAQTTAWSGLKVTLNCASSPERIRVTNDSASAIVVHAITTLTDPNPNEPFNVANRIAAGGTRQWQAGPEANGKNVLSRDEILNNAAGDNEGVRIDTSAGSYIARCPKAPDLTGEKWIEVDLSDQHLTAWQGDYRIAEKIVNTGKPGFDTPQGTFFINLKFDYEDMNSCAGDECWNIPRVPWVMYFTDIGHAFHGVYWYNDFGTPRSHGCVNLTEQFAKWLYDWAPLGTRVWNPRVSEQTMYVLADVAIEEQSNFLAMFSTRGAQLRGLHGSTSSQVFAVDGEDRRVIILFEWSSKADFEAFLSDPQTRDAMKASGTVGRPIFTILEKLAEYAS